MTAPKKDFPEVSDMDNTTLLETLETAIKACHYDPLGEHDGYKQADTANAAWAEVLKRMEDSDHELPECDSCHRELSYMPWHYSTETDRHLHACDQCWSKVNPNKLK